MADFLLELLSEEIPARMQQKACADLARLFADEIGKAGLSAGAIETYATPRRLALIARGLPEATQAVAEETKGPRVGAPPQALEGFLRKTGLSADQLTERDGVLYAIVDRPGRPTAQVLAEAIPAIVRAFPWPKSMRWGEGSLRWVRPLQGIVALLGDEIVPFEIDGLASGAATVGHRFHHPGPITIGSADDYAAKLRACHVILDPAERSAIIEAGAAEAAAAAGLIVVADPGLVAENAGLTEWPVPLLGAFDPAFLEVPREVIQLTMRTNQKYFACVDGAGALAPNFICTANVDALDGGAGIVAGNRKVLAARLADAKFFWEQDLKVPLAQQAEKLAGIVFHEKLGTVADKVDRVAKLARWLVEVEEGIVAPSPEWGESRGEGERAAGERATFAPVTLTQSSPSRERASLADLAEQAARLCKADLVTGMVGEFPELQGVIGGYYARAEGLPDEVADAIRDHYKPVGQGDEVPTAPVTVAVSLADKLDTLVSFFAISERPTGSKDPFALRRASLGILDIIVQNKIRIGFRDLFREAFLQLISRLVTKCHLVEADWLYEERLVPLLGRQSAYRSTKRIVVLNEEPPHIDFIERGNELISAWALSWLQAQGRIRFEICSLSDLIETLGDYVFERIKERQKREGIRADMVAAVLPPSTDEMEWSVELDGETFSFATNRPKHNWSIEDDLVRLLARVRALQGFVATDDGANLLAGYKRAANILRIEEKRDGGASASVTLAEAGVHSGTSATGSEEGASVEVDSRLRRNDGKGGTTTPLTNANQMGYILLPEEEALTHALETAEPAATTAIAAEDFEGAMRALAALRAPIDAFFEKVTVNDPDPAKRMARLALLARVRDAVHRVADFSRIEG